MQDPHSATRHALKNTLTVAQGYAQLLARELVKATPDPTRQARCVLGLQTALADLDRAIERHLGPEQPA